MKRSHVAPVVVGALALILAGATTADARRPEASLVTLPELHSAYVCGGALWAAYDLVELLPGNHQRHPVQDDGRQDVQVLSVNGRSGPNGMWITVHNTTGSDNAGEGRKRVPMVNISGAGIAFSFVRLVRTDQNGWTSVELRPVDACPAP